MIILAVTLILNLTRYKTRAKLKTAISNPECKADDEKLDNMELNKINGDNTYIMKI